MSCKVALFYLFILFMYPWSALNCNEIWKKWFKLENAIIMWKLHYFDFNRKFSSQSQFFFIYIIIDTFHKSSTSPPIRCHWDLNFPSSKSRFRIFNSPHPLKCARWKFSHRFSSCSTDVNIFGVNKLVKKKWNRRMYAELRMHARLCVVGALDM